MQQILIQDELISQCREKGVYLIEQLRGSLTNLTNVGDIRGRGLFVGIEFVKDKLTKEPFDPCDKVASRVRKAIFDRDVAIYPGTGSVDGVRGDHMIIAPPFIVTKEELDHIVIVCRDALLDVFATIKKEQY